MQTHLQRLILWLNDATTQSTDTESIRIRKFAAASIQFIGSISLLMWAVVFIALGYWTAAVINLISVGLVIINLAMFVWTKDLTRNVNSILGVTLIWAFALQSVLGGLFKSGFVSIWGVFCPLIASVLLSKRHTIFWLIAFVASFAVAAAFDPEISRLVSNVPSRFSITNGVMNVAVFAAILVGSNIYLVAQLDDARERSDHLLLNILPAPIAERLKRNPGTIADAHNEVTVLFADIVGFTQMSADAKPVDVVNMLNSLFSDFDGLATKHGLEKIKTIGDAYMVVGGLPAPRHDHTKAVAEMALDMLDVLQNRRAWNGEQIRLRVGINTGPVVAGVIGQHKFTYDLWGDTVNIASRMESNSMPNMIQVSEATYIKLNQFYQFEKRQPFDIKGKGQTTTYMLKGRIREAHVSH